MPAWLRVVFFTALGLAGLSLFVLAATSSDSKLFERWFPVLLIINQAIAAALFVVVSAMAFRLIQNVRNRVFGAKMTARLALTVAGMVLIPCALIYFVSSGFISRSIDSWFDVRVEKALDSGVTITRGILTEQQQQIEVQAQHMASLLTNTPVSMILPELLKQLENRPNQEALVFLSNGTAVAAAGSRINVLMPDMPTAAQLQTVKNTGIYSVIDGDAFENYDALRLHSRDCSDYQRSITRITSVNPRTHWRSKCFKCRSPQSSAALFATHSTCSCRYSKKRRHACGRLP